MQKGFAIIVLLCCAVGVGVAADAPQAWINAVDTNAMERVLYCAETVAALTSVCPVLRTAGGFAAQQKMKWCAAEQQIVRSTFSGWGARAKGVWGTNPNKDGLGLGD